MDEQEFQEGLRELLLSRGHFDYLPVVDVFTLAEKGLLTDDNGLVVQLEDNSEFQLILIKRQK